MHELDPHNRTQNVQQRTLTKRYAEYVQATKGSQVYGGQRVQQFHVPSTFLEVMEEEQIEVMEMEEDILDILHVTEVVT